MPTPTDRLTFEQLRECYRQAHDEVVVPHTLLPEECGLHQFVRDQLDRLVGKQLVRREDNPPSYMPDLIGRNPDMPIQTLAIDEFEATVGDIATLSPNPEPGIQPLQPGDYVTTEDILAAGGYTVWREIATLFRDRALASGMGPGHTIEGPGYTSWHIYRYYAWFPQIDDRITQCIVCVDYLDAIPQNRRRQRSVPELLALARGQTTPVEPPPADTIRFDPGAALREEIDSRIARLEHRKRDQEQSRAQYQERLDGRKQTLARAEEWEQLPADAMPDALRRYIAEALFGDVMEARRAAVTHYEAELAQIEDSLSQTVRNLTSARREKLNAEKMQPLEFTPKTMEEELKQLPQYRPGSIQVDGRNGVISWEFSGARMSPNRNQYHWLSGGEQELRILLPDIRIELQFESNTVSPKFFFANDTDRDNGFMSYSARHVPHPHVMQDNSPCLGDFNEPVNQAAMSGDLRTVADLLLAFLGQAEPTDIAGAHWWKFALAHWNATDPDNAPVWWQSDLSACDQYAWDTESRKRLTVQIDDDGRWTLTTHADLIPEEYRATIGNVQARISDAEYEDGDGEVRCRECDGWTDGDGRFTNDCECCAECEEYECQCCHICEHHRDDCECCHDCERRAEDCVCDPD